MSMQSMKESSILQYVNNVDLKNDLSIKKIKQDLLNILGETPGIEINYQKDAFLNELTGEAQEVKKLNSIKITFTDLDNNFKTVEYLL